MGVGGGATGRFVRHLVGLSVHGVCARGSKTWSAVLSPPPSYPDLNFMESSSTGPLLPVAILPRTNQVMMVTMDSRLSLPVFKVGSGLVPGVGVTLDCREPVTHEQTRVGEGGGGQGKWTWGK